VEEQEPQHLEDVSVPGTEQSSNSRSDSNGQEPGQAQTSTISWYMCFDAVCNSSVDVLVTGLKTGVLSISM
jgi:hypothetical protein